MLGKLTLGHQHLAAATNAPATADRVNVHAQRARRLQQGRSQRKAATPPRGGENYQSILTTHK